jgi:hypothetical protein
VRPPRVLRPGPKLQAARRVREAGAPLGMVVMVVSPDGRLLDCAVHAFDLAVGPRVIGPGQAVLDCIGFADHVEAHGPGLEGVPVAGLFGDLDPVAGEDGVDLVGDGLRHAVKELPRGAPVRRFTALGDGEPGGPVDGHDERELAFCRLHFGDVDMKEPDGAALAFCRFGLSPSISGRREMPCR